MTNNKLLRLSATLLFIGIALSDVLHFLHPGGGPSYEATFAVYAASEDWAAIHLGQFVGDAFLLAGLPVLFFALDLSEGAPRWLAIFGTLFTGVALALSAVLYAVDGVALKQSVDAWASAPAAAQAARLASAEAIRWLEWGMNSYWNFTRGVAMVLYAIAIVWTARVPRPIGFLLGLAGVAFIGLGWMVGTIGFTPAGDLPSYTGYTSLFVLIVWLLILAWRPKAAAPAAAGDQRASEMRVS